MLVKPLTYMNDSGLAVRKVLAREHAPLSDLLVVADDFALPFGKLRFREAGGHGGHNGLRSIIDELGTEKFSRLRVGIGDPVRNGRDHVLSRVRAGRGPAARRAPRRRGRRGRGMGAGGHEQGGQPVQHVRAAAGRHRPAGRARRGRRAARRGWRPAHEDRLAADAAGASDGDGPMPDDPGAHAADPRPARPRPADRRAGRRRFRRAARAARGRGRDRLRRRGGRCRGRRRPRGDRAAAAVARRAADATAPTRRRPDRCRASTAGPLGAAAAARRDRLVRQRCASGSATPPTSVAGAAPPRRPGRRPARREDVPRRGPRHWQEPHRLDRPRRRDRRPRRGGARGVAGRSGRRRRPGAADRPGLRAQRARRRRDRGPGRGPGRLAQRRRAGPRGQRPGAPPAHHRPGRPARRSRASCGSGRGSARTRCSATCSTSATRRSSRSPVAASSPGAAASSTSSRRRSTLPIRIELFGDEIDSLRAFDPTDQRADRARSSAPCSCPPRSSCCRRRAWPRSASASGGPPGASASGWPPTSPGSRATADDPLRTRHVERPRLARPQVGDAAEVWARPARAGDRARSRPARARSSSSTSRATSPRPPRSCGARRTSAARELVEAGELPKDWPSTYLPPRDWKGRLVGVADARADLGVGAAGGRGDGQPARAARGDLFGWREPILPLGRAGRLGGRGRGAGRRTARGSCSPPTRRRGSPRSWPRPTTRSRSVDVLAEAPPPGRHRAHRPQPQRRVRGRAGRPDLRHRPRAVRDRPGPPAEGASPGRARATSSSA